MKRICRFFDRLREEGIGIFGRTPYRRRGFLENLVGNSPAIILDTSAIIDLEAEDRRKKLPAGSFICGFDDSKIVIPQGVYDECMYHKHMDVNEHTREISYRTMKAIDKMFRDSRKIFEMYDRAYGDSLKFAVYTIAKELEDSPDISIGRGEISDVDREVVARALELSTLRQREEWSGFKPTHVTILTSDHHVGYMFQRALGVYGFSGASLFSTKRQ